MTTKESIQKAFCELYAKKEYNCMTVKEVCLKAPVARTTFYSYYQNIDEVKNEIENNLISGITQIALNLSKGNMETLDFSLFLSQTMDYVQKNRKEIYLFLITQPNARFIVKWKKAIKKHFHLRFPEKTNLSNYELISETVASGVIGAYSYWLKNPDKVDSDKLNHIVVSMLGHIAQSL